MKSSVGVTICAVIVLIGSGLALLGAASAAFMFAGPLSGQLFDSANLPPGTDVGMMRAGALLGSLMFGAFGTFGIATGIGLIRLWKWARYAAIVLGILVIVFTILPGLLFAFMPMPPPSTPNGAVPAGFRMVLAGFYLFWAALAGVFVYVMMRKSTVAQFNGGSLEMAPRARPLSISIIAWFMIVSAVMGLPMMAVAHLPAFVLGLVLSGGVAKAYYIIYFSLFALVGIGLLKRTSEAMAPAIGLQVFGIANALVMLVPSVWTRLQQTMAGTRMFNGAPAVAAVPASVHYFSVASGVLLPAVILFFLLRARRKLPVSSNQ